MDLNLQNELKKWLLSCARGRKAEIAGGGGRNECMCLFLGVEVKCVFVVQVNTVK